MRPVDVLLVSLGSTTGLRAADDAFATALREAGATVAVVRATPPRAVRTLMLTDLAWARAARVAARRGITEHRPAAVVYSTTTAALLWPRPGAIRYDAPAAANRPGRHGLWQRPLERRRLREAPLLVPVDAATLAETPHPHADAVVVPIPVVRSADAAPPRGGAAARDPASPRDLVARRALPTPRDVAALTYAADPHKKGLDRVLAAWATARRDGEELVVAGLGAEHPAAVAAPGVRYAGRLAPDAYRALLRRTRVYVTAPRREDYGLAQLEALADGAILVTTPAPGPYAALPLARTLDPRLVTDDLAPALRAALDTPVPGYAVRAATLLAPFTPAAAAEAARAVLATLGLDSG